MDVEHMFSVQKHMFSVQKHKFPVQKHKFPFATITYFSLVLTKLPSSGEFPNSSVSNKRISECALSSIPVFMQLSAPNEPLGG